MSRRCCARRDAPRFSGDTMLSQYDPINVDVILREETAPPPVPPAADRAAWRAIKDAIGADLYAAMIAAAEVAASELVPSLPVTLFVEFFRSGSRQEYETPWFRRREMMAELALAECLEYEGRFLDPLLNVVWAICEESSWELPAHHHDMPDVQKPVVALFSTLTATQLAELLLVLGPQLNPLVEKRIRHEVNQRILTPFLTRHDFWWLFSQPGRKLNNWTGVCVGNVIAAAIHLEQDPSRLAEIIARGARSLDDYLETFDSEGGSTEGPGYWSFGFGNYVLAGQLIHHRTNGRIDFFADDLIRRIAQFPLRTLLSPDSFVNFSDCDADITLSVPLLVYLARHYGLDDLMRLANNQDGAATSRGVNNNLSWKLRELVWRPDPALDQCAIPARHDWYPEMQWMIARYNPADPNALTLAAKGGHNDEMHNQNDVGNIIVHVNQTSVIADIGRGRYTRQYFSTGRYEYVVNSSLGHSLPVPNGCAQLPGEEYTALVLDHQADDSRDLLVLELKDAYPPQADLKSLQRTVTLHRDAPRGWVELVDEVKFVESGRFESGLTTFGTVEIGPDFVQITQDGAALTIRYDPAVVAARAETRPNVDLATGPRDIRRVVFALPESQEAARVRLEIMPT